MRPHFSSRFSLVYSVADLDAPATAVPARIHPRHLFNVVTAAPFTASRTESAACPAPAGRQARPGRRGRERRFPLLPGLDRALFKSLATSDWLREHQHLAITGPTDTLLMRTQVIR